MVRIFEKKVGMVKNKVRVVKPKARIVEDKVGIVKEKVRKAKGIVIQAKVRKRKAEDKVGVRIISSRIVKEGVCKAVH